MENERWKNPYWEDTKFYRCIPEGSHWTSYTGPGMHRTGYEIREVRHELGGPYHVGRLVGKAIRPDDAMVMACGGEYFRHLVRLVNVILEAGPTVNFERWKNAILVLLDAVSAIEHIMFSTKLWEERDRRWLSEAEQRMRDAGELLDMRTTFDIQFAVGTPVMGRPVKEKAGDKTLPLFGEEAEWG